MIGKVDTLSTGNQLTDRRACEQYLYGVYGFHWRPRVRPVCLISSSETGRSCLNSSAIWRVAPSAVAMSTRASRVICPVDSNRLMVDSETPAIFAKDLRERFCASRASRALAPIFWASSPGASREWVRAKDKPRIMVHFRSIIRHYGYYWFKYGLLFLHDLGWSGVERPQALAFNAQADCAVISLFQSSIRMIVRINGGGPSIASKTSRS